MVLTPNFNKPTEEGGNKSNKKDETKNGNDNNSPKKYLYMKQKKKKQKFENFCHAINVKIKHLLLSFAIQIHIY